MHIQAEQCSQTGIAPASQPERLQTSIEAALLFVEEAVEQNDGLEFLERALEERGVGDAGNQFGGLARQDLLATDGRFRTGVEVQAAQLGAVEKTALHQDTERILHLGVQGGGKFVGEITAWRMADQGLSSSQQGSVTGEPDVLEGPKSQGIETSDTREGVETASVGIAGQVMELFELAEDGQFD